MGEQGEEIEPEGVDEVETSEVEKPVDEQGEAVEMGETVEQE